MLALWELEFVQLPLLQLSNDSPVFAEAAFSISGVFSQSALPIQLINHATHVAITIIAITSGPNSLMSSAVCS